MRFDSITACFSIKQWATSSSEV